MENIILIEFYQGDYKRSRGSALWITINDFNQEEVPIVIDLFLSISFFSVQESQAKNFMDQLGVQPVPSPYGYGEVYRYVKKIK